MTSSVETTRPKKPLTPKKVVGKTVQYGLLMFFLSFFLIPIYVVLVTSLKPLDQVSLQTMWDLPTGIDVANYVLAWEKLGPSLGNSLAAGNPRRTDCCALGKFERLRAVKMEIPRLRGSLHSDSFWNVYPLSSHFDSTRANRSRTRALWGNTGTDSGARYLWFADYDVDFQKLLPQRPR